MSESKLNSVKHSCHQTCLDVNLSWLKEWHIELLSVLRTCLPIDIFSSLSSRVQLLASLSRRQHAFSQHHSISCSHSQWDGRLREYPQSKIRCVDLHFEGFGYIGNFENWPFYHGLLQTFISNLTFRGPLPLVLFQTTPLRILSCFIMPQRIACSNWLVRERNADLLQKRHLPITYCTNLVLFHAKMATLNHVIEEVNVCLGKSAFFLFYVQLIQP